jgi:hypothetical protein
MDAGGNAITTAGLLSLNFIVLFVKRLPEYMLSLFNHQNSQGVA